MPLLYTDASALVKLVRDEPESPALRAALSGADLVASDLVLAEVPRAIRRAAAQDPGLPAEALVARAQAVCDAVALHPVDRGVLRAAGALGGPELRTLDAIHVVAAALLSPLDGFVTYDRRQATAAALAGLVPTSPGC